jgi:hypothetical protein
LLSQAFRACRVVFWGKIQGKVGDYMIAQGFGGKPDGEVTDDQTIRGDDVIAEYFSTLKTIPKRTYMLGADGISWTELPKVGPSLLSLSARIFRVKGLGLRV